ncbi:DUF320 domain-containing protein, partial [Arthrobacter sp. AB6]|nr:DUF320 domain-containing protein [Arthrobacter sp. AB6]
MSANLRRGLLGTLFAGGLLALGCTAANAADTTSGSDLSASALISAAAADSTSLDLLGGPTPSDTTAVAAVVDTAVNLGTVTGTDNGTATDLTAAAAVDLGTGNTGTGSADAVV